MDVRAELTRLASELDDRALEAHGEWDREDALIEAKKLVEELRDRLPAEDSDD